MNMRRFLFVMAIVGLVFAIAAPSSVAQKKKNKKKKKQPVAVTTQVKVEATAWYWESQESSAASDITGGCPAGVPVCPDQRLGLPNPHEIGALPVQILQGQDEKVSAIGFDLAPLQDLTNGAEISTFSFTVTESPDGRDRAQFVNAADKSILACLISDGWENSEDGAEDMENAPPFDCATSAAGTRTPGEGDAPATWSFDISQIAQPWGEDPYDAHGVALVGQKAGNESWQIVLKGPRRDTQETPVNEEEANASNVKASITYTAIPEEELPESSDSGAATTPPTTAPVTTTPVTTTPVASTADFGIGSSAAAPPAPAPVEEIPETAAIQPVATELPGPEMPAYVWALIPIGLLALSMVRSAIMDPVAGKRADGVVALIRERNAQRRGTPLSPSAASPLAGVTRFFRSAGGGFHRGGRSLVRGMGKLTKRS